MKNEILNQSLILPNELISYFSPEIMCLVAIFLNLVIYLLFKKKPFAKRLSDAITFGVFVVNFFIILSLYVRNTYVFKGFGFSIFHDLIVFSNENLLFKLFINIFFILFVITCYKLTRKARFKVPVVNSVLLLLAISSSILIQMEHVVLSFLLLDVSCVLIYKFATSARIRKDEIYSSDFVLMSGASTFLFFAFYFLMFALKQELQLAIMQVCLTCALMLKAGLFPISNYTLNKHTKTNIGYEILLYLFLPVLGVISCTKLIQSVDFSNEVYLLTVVAFCTLIMLSSAIYAFRVKNLVKYFAYIVQFNCALYLIAIMFSFDCFLYIKMLLCLALAVFGLYSLLCVLKYDLKLDKINFSKLKGIALKNRLFCWLFSILLLIACLVVPSVLMQNHISVLKVFYTYDKLGEVIILCAIFSGILIILNALRIIKKCYTIDRNDFEQILIKRTASGYAVPILIIIFLIVKMFF